MSADTAMLSMHDNIPFDRIAPVRPDAIATVALGDRRWTGAALFDRLLQACAAERTVRVRIEDCLDAALCDRLLPDMVAAHATAAVDLCISLVVRGQVSAAHAAALRTIGVEQVEILPGEGGTLDTLAAVKHLTAAEIAVRWSAAGLVEADLPFVRHLPPPDTARPRHALIDRWTAAYRPYQLVYSRGPGFLRIRDVRSDDPDRASIRNVVVLKGAQAAIHDHFDSPAAADAAAADALGVTPGQLGPFLDALVDRHLISTDGHRFLSLAVHRKLAEAG